MLNLEINKEKWLADKVSKAVTEVASEEVAVEIEEASEVETEEVVRYN